MLKADLDISVPGVGLCLEAVDIAFLNPDGWPDPYSGRQDHLESEDKHINWTFHLSFQRVIYCLAVVGKIKSL